MNGYEVYNRALIRLGYNDSDNKEVYNMGLTEGLLDAVNQILSDLKLNGVKNLSEEINADSSVLEALACGVAMLLTVSIGDCNKNVIFTALYNAKRMAVLSKTEFIKDNLPVTEG